MRKALTTTLPDREGMQQVNAKLQKHKLDDNTMLMRIYHDGKMPPEPSSHNIKRGPHPDASGSHVLSSGNEEIYEHLHNTKWKPGYFPLGLKVLPGEGDAD
jgi:hypothetical protein